MMKTRLSLATIRWTTTVRFQLHSSHKASNIDSDKITDSYYCYYFDIWKCCQTFGVWNLDGTCSVYYCRL